MNLDISKAKLNELGFEVVISDNLLQAARETGDEAMEITIDSGGGCLVVKKKKLKIENGKLKIGHREVPIVCEKLSTKMFRVQLDSLDDFKLVEKKLSGE